MNEHLDEKLKNKLRPILRDHQLAKFGDTLTNLVYSIAKTKVNDSPFGERVFDKSLAQAIKALNLRVLLPSNITSGEIGDGAEALIGYAYLNKLMTIEEMSEIISTTLDISHYSETSRSEERDIMTSAFTELLKGILDKLRKAG